MLLKLPIKLTFVKYDIKHYIHISIYGNEECRARESF